MTVMSLIKAKLAQLEDFRPARGNRLWLENVDNHRNCLEGLQTFAQTLTLIFLIFSQSVKLVDDSSHIYSTFQWFACIMNPKIELNGILIF